MGFLKGLADGSGWTDFKNRHIPTKSSCKERISITWHNFGWSIGVIFLWCVRLPIRLLRRYADILREQQRRDVKSKKRKKTKDNQDWNRNILDSAANPYNNTKN